MDFLRAEGILDDTIVMVISDNGASAEGVDRDDERGAVLQQRPGDARGEPGGQSTRSAARPTSTTIRGVDLAGNTRFPALEARDLPGRLHRPVHRQLAGGDQGAREIRQQYAHINRHGAHPARPARRRTADGDPWCHPVADARVSFAPPSTMRQRPDRHRTQYFEMLATGRSTGRLRPSVPWPGPSFAEAGTGFGTRSRPRSSPSSTPPAGSCTRRRGPGGEPRLAASTANKLIELIGTWYVEAGKYGSCRSTAAASPGWWPRTAHLRAARSVHVIARHQTIPTSRRRACSIGRTASPPRSRSRGRCRGRPALPGSRGGGYSLYVKDGRLHYVHNYVARNLFGVSSPDPLPAGPHELRFEFEPTGQPDLPHGQGRPGPAPALRRRRARRHGRRAAHHAVHVQPRRRRLRAQPGIACDPEYRARSPSRDAWTRWSWT